MSKELRVTMAEDPIAITFRGTEVVIKITDKGISFFTSSGEELQESWSKDNITIRQMWNGINGLYEVKFQNSSKKFMYISPKTNSLYLYQISLFIVIFLGIFLLRSFIASFIALSIILVFALIVGAPLVPNNKLKKELKTHGYLS
jgi:hypothetical protein